MAVESWISCVPEYMFEAFWWERVEFWISGRNWSRNRGNFGVSIEFSCQISYCVCGAFKGFFSLCLKLQLFTGNSFCLNLSPQWITNSSCIESLMTNLFHEISITEIRNQRNFVVIWQMTESNSRVQRWIGELFISPDRRKWIVEHTMTRLLLYLYLCSLVSCYKLPTSPYVSDQAQIHRGSRGSGILSADDDLYGDFSHFPRFKRRRCSFFKPSASHAAFVGWQ